LVRQTQLPMTNELVLDPAPELPVQVRWVGGTEWSEAIAMPANRTEHAADVVVRPRR
jgi:hypothetical protein